MKRQLVEFVFFFVFRHGCYGVSRETFAREQINREQELGAGCGGVCQKKRHSNEILLANNKMRYHVL